MKKELDLLSSIVGIVDKVTKIKSRSERNHRSHREERRSEERLSIQKERLALSKDKFYGGIKNLLDLTKDSNWIPTSETMKNIENNTRKQ